jgi:hypothetical protein
MFGKLGWRIAVPAAAALAAAVIPAASAAAAAGPVQDPVPIRPNQYFEGRVNATAPKATINVLCAGPASTGHPLKGQTVEVNPVLDPITTYDGYHVNKAISTSVTVPCGGTGTMRFVPAPRSSTAKSAKVQVTFRNIGA